MNSGIPETAEVVPADENQPSPTPEQDTSGIRAEDFINDPNLPYTGTLSPDDPDNEELREQIRLFGEEEAEDEASDEVEGATHLLKFEFVSQVQFSDPLDPLPHLEVEYTNQIETPIKLGPVAQTVKVQMTIDPVVRGFLTENEFWLCNLDVAVPAVPVDVTVRLFPQKTEEPTERTEGEAVVEPPTDEPQIYSCAVKLNVGLNIPEDWYSNCIENTAGATLKTQGDTENYDAETLKAIKPSLQTLVIDECLVDQENEIPLELPPVESSDTAISKRISYSGAGSLTIELLE